MNPDRSESTAENGSQLSAEARQLAAVRAAIRLASHDITNAVGVTLLQLDMAVRVSTSDPAQLGELLASLREEARSIVTSLSTLTESTQASCDDGPTTRPPPSAE